MRTACVTSLMLLALGCGVPQTQYDAAVDDAKKARAECDAKLAEHDKANLAAIDDLKQKLSDAEARAGNADEQTKAELEELRKAKAAAEARAKLFDEFVGKLRKMIDAGKLDITIRRGQIVLALGTDILFDTGKAEIKPDGKQALGEVAAALRDVPNRRFQVAGHTDNVPIKKPEFPSNWELSTARAIAVVKLLLEKGVHADALSAAGYADQDPVQPNTSDKGKAKNRRIEIVLVPNVEELVKLPEVRKSKEQPAPPKEPPPPPLPAPKK